MHVNKAMPTMPGVSVTSACCPAATAANEVVVEDIFGLVRVLSDGTVLRSPVGPVFCPITFPENHPSVEWKEAVYDKPKNLVVRMYKPSPTPGGGKKKVPVLVHFHGGGFCIGSPSWANVHAFCLRLAADTGAVVLSAGYRLAPEHRLPAAVDDGVGFMRWLREQSSSSANAAEAEADAWLTEAADFTRVFVTGDSAGATIAHHLAVRASVAMAADDAGEAGEPDQVQDHVSICGYVMLLPFFGGVERTPSEKAECPAGAGAGSLLSLDVLDRFWRVSLPAGATRDHPVANPFGPDGPDLGAVEFARPVLVVVAGLDLLRDRAVDYAERLAAVGKPVEVVEFAGAAHGFYLHEPGSEATGELIRAVGRFVHSCVSAAPETAAA